MDHLYDELTSSFVLPCFWHLQLDQSFTPDGIYTFASEDALLFDVQSVKDFGLNAIRLHQKVRVCSCSVHPPVVPSTARANCEDSHINAHRSSTYFLPAGQPRPLVLARGPPGGGGAAGHGAGERSER